MIGSTPPRLPAVDALVRSLENGTVTAGRIEVLNTTPKIQAQLDESFRQSERSTAQLTATYRANPTWAKFDDKSNAVELPDVASLNQNDATHVLKGLQYLLDIGRLDGKAISARNGGLSTDSTAVYQDWLQAQIGVDVHA